MKVHVFSSPPHNWPHLSTKSPGIYSRYPLLPAVPTHPFYLLGGAVLHLLSFHHLFFSCTELLAPAHRSSPEPAKQSKACDSTSPCSNCPISWLCFTREHLERGLYGTDFQMLTAPLLLLFCLQGTGFCPPSPGDLAQAGGSNHHLSADASQILIASSDLSRVPCACICWDVSKAFRPNVSKSPLQCSLLDGITTR